MKHKRISHSNSFAKIMNKKPKVKYFKVFFKKMRKTAKTAKKSNYYHSGSVDDKAGDYRGADGLIEGFDKAGAHESEFVFYDAGGYHHMELVALYPAAHGHPIDCRPYYLSPEIAQLLAAVGVGRTRCSDCFADNRRYMFGIVAFHAC